jgi:hypothetical protein
MPNSRARNMEPWYRVFWKVRFSESPGDGDGRLFAIEEDQ